MIASSFDPPFIRRRGLVNQCPWQTDSDCTGTMANKSTRMGNPSCSNSKSNSKHPYSFNHLTQVYSSVNHYFSRRNKHNKNLLRELDLHFDLRAHAFSFPRRGGYNNSCPVYVTSGLKYGHAITSGFLLLTVHSSKIIAQKSLSNKTA